MDKTEFWLSTRFQALVSGIVALGLVGGIRFFVVYTSRSSMLYNSRKTQPKHLRIKQLSRLHPKAQGAQHFLLSMLYCKIARLPAQKTLFEKYGEESIDRGVPGKSKDY